MRRGATAPEIAVVVIVIAMLFAAVLPELRQGQAISERVEAVQKMRMLATALESYASDNGALYPFGLATGNAAALSALTTPLGYISEFLIDDPFPATQRSGTINPLDGSFTPIDLAASGEEFYQQLRYYSYGPQGFSNIGVADRAAWVYVLTSNAEDGIAMELGNLMEPTATEAAILASIYAPGNGTPPSGDIYRIGGRRPVDGAERFGDKFYDALRFKGAYLTDDPNPPSRLRIAGHILGAMGETVYDMNADLLMDIADTEAVEPTPIPTATPTPTPTPTEEAPPR